MGDDYVIPLKRPKSSKGGRAGLFSFVGNLMPSSTKSKRKLFHIDQLITILNNESIKAILNKVGQGEGLFASPFIDIGTAIIALTVLIVAGVIASLLPALKAASVNPIVALQDE